MTQPLAVGIDIGGTNTSFGIVSRRGEIISKGRISTRGYGTSQEFVLALHSALSPLITIAGKDNIVGLGVGAPNGNYFTGEIMFAPNLPWKGVIPLADMVTDAFNIRTRLTNDAKAAAIGEMMYGAAKGMENFIVITLGTGVGSGFVANGQLIYGHDGFAGEFGHMIVERNGRQCGCGRRGCVETYASATGLVRTAEEWLASRDEPSVLRGHVERIDAVMIHEAAEKGDPLALEIYEYTGRILGYALADAVTITSPQAIIFFGGLARSGELLFKHVRHYMEEAMLPIYRNKIQLLNSALEDSDAAILGASALAW